MSLQEETCELLKEVDALRKQLEELKTYGVSMDGASLAASEKANTLLRESVRAQQLSLAASQCIVSGLLVSVAVQEMPWFL